MANLGLSAKQEKDDRLQKTKQEVAEMVKQRLQYMRSKVCLLFALILLPKVFFPNVETNVSLSNLFSDICHFCRFSNKLQIQMIFKKLAQKKKKR